MFDMLVEQSSRVNPLTSVSSTQGSHHLNHTTHLSPQASHSSSDSSSPRSQHDDSSTTSSSTPLKLNGEGGEEVSVEPRNHNNKNNTTSNTSNNNNNSSSNQSDNFSHIQRLQFAFEKNSMFANYFGANNNNNNSTNNKNNSTSSSNNNNNTNTNMPLPASLNRHQFGQLESKILTRLSLPLGSPSPQSSHIKEEKTDGDDEIDQHQDPFEIETEEEHTSNENHHVHLVQSPTASPTDSNTNATNIFQCPLCSVSCTSRHQFNEHLVSHSQHHVCPKCSFLTTDEDALRSHLQEEHDVNETEVLTDDEVRVPKVNSQGKVKTHKCKQCEYTAVTKMEFWDHVKSHIRQEKMLTCPKCPFVTEYKHHLEYHLRNHFGSKPFQCTKCAYSCVNKSMLNSHLKSHSNVYQYRCADCSYATKYCHSLKLHLRKYQHNPSMVLNLDGTPNPLPIIDVYGTRRGPKIKKTDPTTVDFNQLNNSSNNNNNNNNNHHHISNNNSINSMKTDYKKRSNSNHNNSNSSSGDDGHASPKYIKREYYEETPPPTTKKTKFSTAVSGSDNDSDSDAEPTTNNYHRSLLQHHHLQQQQKQQQQQQQLLRHQMPETPITPTSLALQGLLVANGTHTSNHEQQQQLAAALAMAAGKNHIDMYAALNQYLLMKPLLHMATQQQQQQPYGDLTKFGTKEKPHQQQQSNQRSLSQILNQSPMMPRSLSVSPPLSNHRQGSVQQQQQKQHTTSSMIERDHHQQQQQLHQTPLDLRNPKISPNPYETPVQESNTTEKSRKSRKVKPMRYDRKLLLDPLNLSEKMREEGEDDDEEEHKTNIDSDVALDFSNNNNIHNNNNNNNNSSSKKSTWNRQQVESVRPCKVSPPNEQMLCKYCEIAFPDRVLYSMHMSYHSGDKNPFLCKSCGKHTKDKTSFFLHLTTEAH